MTEQEIIKLAKTNWFGWQGLRELQPEVAAWMESHRVDCRIMNADTDELADFVPEFTCCGRVYRLRPDYEPIMTYTGKLYGRLGGAFFETGYHTSDVDELTAAVKRLETDKAHLMQAVKSASHISVENKLFRDALQLIAGTCEYCSTDAKTALTEAQHAS